MTRADPQWRWYTGHGIVFRSAIDLPELTPIDPPVPAIAEADIRLGPAAADALAKRTGDAMLSGFCATPDGPVLDVDGTVAMLVRDGREITLSIAEGADMGLLRLYLIGSAMGMLFHQRGHLLLHGAAILTDAGVSVFVGESGAGKSTLAAHMGQAGHAILSDDTLVLWSATDHKGGFVAWPGSRVFKLWHNTLQTLAGEDLDKSPKERYQTVAGRIEKFFVPNAVVAPNQPAPITEVIALGRHDGPPMLQPASGLEALKIIADNVYRPEFVGYLDRHDPHFRQIATLSGSVYCARLLRPWDLERMDETLAVLAAHWDAEGRQSSAVP